MLWVTISIIGGPHSMSTQHRQLKRVVVACALGARCCHAMRGGVQFHRLAMLLKTKSAVSCGETFVVVSLLAKVILALRKNIQSVDCCCCCCCFSAFPISTLRARLAKFRVAADSMTLYSALPMFANIKTCRSSNNNDDVNKNQPSQELVTQTTAPSRQCTVNACNGLLSHVANSTNQPPNQPWSCRPKTTAARK